MQAKHLPATVAHSINADNNSTHSKTGMASKVMLQTRAEALQVHTANRLLVVSSAVKIMQSAQAEWIHTANGMIDIWAWQVMLPRDAITSTKAYNFQLFTAGKTCITTSPLPAHAEQSNDGTTCKSCTTEARKNYTFRFMRSQALYRNNLHHRLVCQCSTALLHTFADFTRSVAFLASGGLCILF